MSNIEFISHDSFPEDEYTKEMVYLQLEGKYRVLYVRKTAKNGGIFWNVASAGATRNGQKEFFPAFLQDSNFLEKDIMDFLNKRKWEARASHATSASLNQGYQPQNVPQSMSDAAIDDAIPF